MRGVITRSYNSNYWSHTGENKNNVNIGDKGDNKIHK